MKPIAARSKPTVKRRVLRTGALCCALYLIACAGCASFQRRLIYFPPVFTAPQVEEMGVAEGLTRWTDGAGKPLGWKRLSPVQPATGQVLIMHGNAGCAFQCGHYADVLQQAAPLDVFIVEYPGYADLPGKPTEQTLYQAADAAFQQLAPHSPVYVVGESLGNGVAAHLAGKYPNKIAGAALLAPYNRLAAVGQEHMRLLPVRWILRDRFPAAEDLRNFHGPIAILVAGRDQVIPAKFGRRLYDGYAGPKRLWEFPEKDHGTLMLQPVQVWQEIIAFWQNQ